MNIDFYFKKYNIEIIYHGLHSIEFNKLENVKFSKKPKFEDGHFLIQSKYNLNNNNFYRGINKTDDLFVQDCSFMLNELFDNSYDIILEFSYLDKNENSYHKIGKHHKNCYRGNTNIENIKVHKILFNIFSGYDMTKSLMKIIKKIKDKNGIIIAGIIYDLIDNQNLYICYEFSI